MFQDTTGNSIYLIGGDDDQSIKQNKRPVEIGIMQLQMSMQSTGYIASPLYRPLLAKR
jgi:hypothetical protein